MNIPFKYNLDKTWPAFAISLFFLVLIISFYFLIDKLPDFRVFFPVVITLLLIIPGYIYFVLTSRVNYSHLEKKISCSYNIFTDLSKNLICSFSLDGKWINMNKAGCEILGIRQSEITNTPIYSFFSEYDLERILKVSKEQKDNTGVEFESGILTVNGHYLRIKWNVLLSKEDGIVYLTGKDITLDIKTAEIIKAKNLQLLLAGIIAEFENKKNEELFRKESVILRSQLQSIAGYLEVVINDAKNINNDMMEFLKLALQGSNNILENVEDKLNLKYLKASDVSFGLDRILINDITNNLLAGVGSIDEDEDLRIEIDMEDTNNIYIHGNITRISESILIFMDEIGKLLKEAEFSLKSILKPVLNEIYLNLTCKNFKCLPQVFEREGLLPGRINSIYDFRNNDLPVFLAKSYINIMNGLILYTFNKNKDLVISYRFHIIK
jgi:PAS domain S-box-containing protein